MALQQWIPLHYWLHANMVVALFGQLFSKFEMVKTIWEISCWDAIIAQQLLSMMLCYQYINPVWLIINVVFVQVKQEVFHPGAEQGFSFITYNYIFIYFNYKLLIFLFAVYVIIVIFMFSIAFVLGLGCLNQVFHLIYKKVWPCLSWRKEKITVWCWISDIRNSYHWRYKFVDADNSNCSS